jgi:hypothetical protein
MAWPSSHQKNRPNKYCSYKCAGTEPGTGKRANLFRPNHPLAVSDGRIMIHRFNLYEKIGPGSHPCAWCGKIVKWTPGAGRGDKKDGVLAVDHLDGDTRNNAVENLVPSCYRCNALRGILGMWARETGRNVHELIAHRHYTQKLP